MARSFDLVECLIDSSPESLDRLGVYFKELNGRGNESLLEHVGRQTISCVCLGLINYPFKILLQPVPGLDVEHARLEL